MSRQLRPKGQGSLTRNTLIAVLAGAILGSILRLLPPSSLLQDWLNLPGQLFLHFIFMLVIPVVFSSMVCGASQLGNKAMGRLGLQAIALYVTTTVIAVALALLLASFFPFHAVAQQSAGELYTIKSAPKITAVILAMVPKNIFRAMANGEMLPIVVFALMLGLVLAKLGKQLPVVTAFFTESSKLLTRWIQAVMRFAPAGVFFLIASVFYKMGYHVIISLLQYFLLVILVLALQAMGVYSVLLKVLAGLSPRMFFKKMFRAMLFSFGVSSSVASIPVVMQAVSERLGVQRSIAAFVIPLGATINMDGTAIMQGVATVFIAHSFGLSLSFTHYIMIVALATLASIGTAGVPSVGLITLAMVLEHLGLPTSGIALILGVDRLLDMARTAVNITGDAMISCVTSARAGRLDRSVFNA